MIGLTPLRRILPGDYSQLEVPELIKLRERVLEMEDIMIKQDRYIKSMRSLISGRPVDSLQISEQVLENEGMPEMSEDMVNENQWRDTPEFKERLEALRHRSEEHTSELQSRGHLVCRLLLE